MTGVQTCALPIFGTAKFVPKELPIQEKDDKPVKGSTFVGTAEYVSPEVLLDKQSGFASDLWALGCILYQFFAGNAPFRGKTEFWTFNLIINGEVTYPPVLLFYKVGITTGCERSVPIFTYSGTFKAFRKRS